MRTIAIPQLYCGASGKKGAYNRQEVGLARAFAALGCRAVVLYPDPDAAPEAVTSEDLEPNVRIYYVPARKAGVSAFYRTWQPLLNEHVDAVHVIHRNTNVAVTHRERSHGQSGVGASLAAAVAGSKAQVAVMLLEELLNIAQLFVVECLAAGADGQHVGHIIVSRKTLAAADNLHKHGDQGPVKRLKKALDLEKMRSAGYSHMIELAEQQFNIPIRKKSGTKQ